MKPHLNLSSQLYRRVDLPQFVRVGSYIKSGNDIGRTEGIGLLIALLAYLWFLVKKAKKNTRAQKATDSIEVVTEVTSNFKILLWFSIGGISLWGGSELLVVGAVGIAQFFEVSNRVIAVSMIAVGTSIPELAASVIAVVKKEKAISLGNLVGSNIFNILAVVGITSLITPIPANDHVIYTNDIYWMLLVSMLLPILVLLPKKMELKRKSGIILLLLYVVFLYQTIR